MEETSSRSWTEALFGDLPADFKDAHLLALACALALGHPEVAHHYFKTARRAGASDTELQNVTALTSQITRTDLSPLAFETVWRAADEASKGA
jgi:alkylhydroperoxidase/carboxymuconolactone decarboxylase family protein YurZ